MALKSSFSLPEARTIVIATVSPASKDTEHSLNTLRHACIMHGQQQPNDKVIPSISLIILSSLCFMFNSNIIIIVILQDAETRFVTGGSVTTVQIGEVDLTGIGRKNQAVKKSGGQIDGLKASNGNTVDGGAARAANQEVELTDKEKARVLIINYLSLCTYYFLARSV